MTQRHDSTATQTANTTNATLLVSTTGTVVQIPDTWSPCIDQLESDWADALTAFTNEMGA